MSSLGVLRQADSRLKAAESSLSVISAKLEDLCFRAQRISRALKAREAVKDTTFGAELVDLRKLVRAFIAEAETLPSSLSAAQRGVAKEQGAAECAASVSGSARRLPQSVSHLHELALLVHRHSPEGEARVAAWYMAQELEAAAAGMKTLAANGTAVLRLYMQD